jgi:uncharacterized membrane protein YfcA
MADKEICHAILIDQPLRRTAAFHPGGFIKPSCRLYQEGRLMDILQLMAAGALAGFLNGWLGLGGMSVIVPALMHAGLAVPDAFGNAFAVTAINSVVAWAAFHRRGFVDYRSAAALALPAVPASILAFAAMLWADAANSAALMLGIFLLAMGGGMWQLRHVQSAAAVVPRSAWGVAGGLLSGMFGFNGNAFFIPVLRRHGLAPHRSVATVHAIGACIAASAVIVYVAWGRGRGAVAVDPYMAGYLTIGGLASGRLGGFLKMKTPPRQLAILLCAAYLTSGALLLAKHVGHPASSVGVSSPVIVEQQPSAGLRAATVWHGARPPVSLSTVFCCADASALPLVGERWQANRSELAIMRRRTGQPDTPPGLAARSPAPSARSSTATAFATECRLVSAPRCRPGHLSKGLA